MNRQGRFWLPVHFMNGDLEQLRSTAKHHERYARLSRERIWTGNRDDLINALSDVAEAGEIARRLYAFLQQHTCTTPTQRAQPLKDEPMVGR